jgi:hypothetical protein
VFANCWSIDIKECFLRVVVVLDDTERAWRTRRLLVWIERHTWATVTFLTDLNIHGVRDQPTSPFKVLRATKVCTLSEPELCDSTGVGVIGLAEAMTFITLCIDC